MPQEFNGWERTIRNQRTDLELALMDSPSLKAIWNEAFDIAFRLALRNVRDEYEKKGYHIPEQRQFRLDIEAMLRVKFWDD
ncbi:MAG: DUF29 family protein, partial [Pseudanabaena sp.]